LVPTTEDSIANVQAAKFMKQHKSFSTLFRRLPPKWTLGLLVLLFAYICFQPLLNRRLGWRLPSLAELAVPNADSQVLPDNSSSPGGGTQAEWGDSNRQRPDASPGDDFSDLTYGYLKQTGNAQYLSPAGLRYTPGSEEGHRLKHIAKHLVDDPTRPGSHGVFVAAMPQVLAWLDETYRKAEAGEPGSKKANQDQRTVYEADLGVTVGYVGGQSGNRRQTPPSSRIRLVTEGKRVITAFPF
jgi:hypothetical protein